jgi:cytochrome c-type biogenesis protein CcmF
MGIVCETTWNSEKIVAMKPGDRATVAGYTATLTGFSQRDSANYRETLANFQIARDRRPVGVMAPSKRTFVTREASTTETALLSRGLSQLYISLGERNSDGTVVVRLYYKPLVLLIWLGAVVMVAGGALSLSDRRLRIGAPQPARSARSLQAAE